MDFRRRKYYLIIMPSYCSEDIISFIKYMVPHTKIHKLSSDGLVYPWECQIKVGCHTLKHGILIKLLLHITNILRYANKGSDCSRKYRVIFNEITETNYNILQTRMKG